MGTHLQIICKITESTTTTTQMIGLRLDDVPTIGPQDNTAMKAHTTTTATMKTSNQHGAAPAWRDCKCGDKFPKKKNALSFQGRKLHRNGIHSSPPPPPSCPRDHEACSHTPAVQSPVSCKGANRGIRAIPRYLAFQKHATKDDILSWNVRNSKNLALFSSSSSSSYPSSSSSSAAAAAANVDIMMVGILVDDDSDIDDQNAEDDDDTLSFHSALSSSISSYSI